MFQLICFDIKIRFKKNNKIAKVSFSNQIALEIQQKKIFTFLHFFLTKHRTEFYVNKSDIATLARASLNNTVAYNEKENRRNVKRVVLYVVTDNKICSTTKKKRDENMGERSLKAQIL